MRAPGGIDGRAERTRHRRKLGTESSQKVSKTLLIRAVHPRWRSLGPLKPVSIGNGRLRPGSLITLGERPELAELTPDALRSEHRRSSRPRSSVTPTLGGLLASELSSDPSPLRQARALGSGYDCKLGTGIRNSTLVPRRSRKASLTSSSDGGAQRNIGLSRIDPKPTGVPSVIQLAHDPVVLPAPSVTVPTGVRPPM
jgi:hypothetical protein